MWTKKGAFLLGIMRPLLHPVQRPPAKILAMWGLILFRSLNPNLGRGVFSGTAQHCRIFCPHRKTASFHSERRLVVSAIACLRPAFCVQCDAQLVRTRHDQAGKDSSVSLLCFCSFLHDNTARIRVYLIKKLGNFCAMIASQSMETCLLGLLLRSGQESHLGCAEGG